MNTWCEALGITPPKLEVVIRHPEANHYALLLVALLERGEPMTLEEVAARFEEAGFAERGAALAGLKRCRPARPPVYRDGDRYHLDPHDKLLDLWMFQLGLRGPKVTPPPKPPPPPPLPVTERLTKGELDEAFREASLFSWSAQRLVLAVLDAEGKPMRGEEIVAALSTRTKWHPLKNAPATFQRKGSAVEVRQDGTWAMAPGTETTLQQARTAVRKRVEVARKYLRHDPEEFAARDRERQTAAAAHARELGAMTRAVLVAVPEAAPKAAALLDVQKQEVVTYVGKELDALRRRLSKYEILVAIDIRALLRRLGFDPGTKRLVELGPPQKTLTSGGRSRALRLTPELVIRSSCRIPRAIADRKKLTALLARGKYAEVRDAMEKELTALVSLYEYARVHGAVRVSHRGFYQMLPVGWVHWDEPRLYSLKKSAFDHGVPLEIVVGRAPDWRSPWTHSLRIPVKKDAQWGYWLVTQFGEVVHDDDVQRARLSVDVQ